MNMDGMEWGVVMGELFMFLRADLTSPGLFLMGLSCTPTVALVELHKGTDSF